MTCKARSERGTHRRANTLAAVPLWSQLLIVELTTVELSASMNCCAIVRWAISPLRLLGYRPHLPIIVSPSRTLAVASPVCLIAVHYRSGQDGCGCRSNDRRILRRRKVDPLRSQIQVSGRCCYDLGSAPHTNVESREQCTCCSRCFRCVQLRFERQSSSRARHQQRKSNWVFHVLYAQQGDRG